MMCQKELEFASLLFLCGFRDFWKPAACMVLCVWLSQYSLAFVGLHYIAAREFQVCSLLWFVHREAALMWCILAPAVNVFAVLANVTFFDGPRSLGGFLAYDVGHLCFVGVLMGAWWVDPSNKEHDDVFLGIMVLACVVTRACVSRQYRFPVVLGVAMVYAQAAQCHSRKTCFSTVHVHIHHDRADKINHGTVCLCYGKHFDWNDGDARQLWRANV
jgi:hypothetical protein